MDDRQLTATVTPNSPHGRGHGRFTSRSRSRSRSTSIRLVTVTVTVTIIRILFRRRSIASSTNLFKPNGRINRLG